MQKMIIAVRLMNKQENSPKFQDIISKYGQVIKTRVGISDEPHRGVIILYVNGENEDLNKLTTDLQQVDGLWLEKMEIPN